MFAVGKTVRENLQFCKTRLIYGWISDFHLDQPNSFNNFSRLVILNAPEQTSANSR